MDAARSPGAGCFGFYSSGYCVGVWSDFDCYWPAQFIAAAGTAATRWLEGSSTLSHCLAEASSTVC